MSRWTLLLSILISLSIGLIAQQASAQILNIDLNQGMAASCAATGGGETVFQNRGNDGSRGTLQSTCNSQAGVFARFFCIFETTIGLVIGTVFCSIRDAWLAPFGAMLSLFMAGMGLMFITGLLNMNRKELSVILFKVGLITMFVTNADVAVEIAYSFFISLTKETVRIMMEGLNRGFQTSGVPAQMAGFDGVDTLLTGIQDYWTDMRAGTANAPCSVMVFLLGLLLALPFASAIIFFAILSFFAFFARAAYGYLFSLVMITFLLAAMPIFVSFALFRTTRDLFDNWISYIGSHAIQIFIVFGLMAFASAVDFMDFLGQIGGILTSYEQTLLPAPFFIKVELCTICTPNVTNLGAIPQINGCTDPSPINWFDLPQHKDFFRFLLVHGAVLYILTYVMNQFMTMGPDIARMLGGVSMIHSIGGNPSGGPAGGLNSAIHTATARFESGARKEWDKKDPDKRRGIGGMMRDSAFGRMRRALSGGTKAAVDGEYLMDAEQLSEADKQLFESRKDIAEQYGSARGDYVKADEYFDSLMARYQAGDQNITQQDINQALIQKSQAEAVLKQTHRQMKELQEYDHERGDGLADSNKGYGADDPTKDDVLRVQKRKNVLEAGDINISPAADTD